MAEQDTFQLQGNAPQNYEEQSVPAIFRTLAELTLRQVEVPAGARVIVEVPAGARVIDVACGTGIVARLVAKKSARLDRW